MTSPFLKLFGKSPFDPLCKHMETAYHCAKQLIPFYQAVIAGNWQEAGKAQQQLAALEHEADSYKRDFRLNLPKDMFLPVARGDLLELISYQDHIANTAKDIAGLMLGRKMQIPEQLSDHFAEFLTRCIDAAKQAFKAIRELGDLYEAGFTGKETAIIDDMIKKLHIIEHDTDEMQINLRKRLYEIEQQLPPINVIFLYEVIARTGRLADQAQKIGDRLQICIAR